MDKKFTADWIPLIDKYVNRLKRGTRVKMLNKNWDEFSVNIKTHIWNKSHLYNEKYPAAAWIKMVVKNNFYNYARDNFFTRSKNKITKTAKQNLIFTESLNDVIDNNRLNYSFNKITIDEFKECLNKIELDILSLKIAGFEEREIAKELNIKMGKVYRANIKLRREYKKLLDKDK